MSVPAPSRSDPRRSAAAAAAVLLASIHFASHPLADHPISTDVRNFLYYAARIAHGALPHADFFENKPPLAFFVGAAFHRAAEGLGYEPLLGVRVGYLTLAALGGLLTAALHRRLSGGCSMSGLLALATYCGFPLVGGLPCIGNVPKLLMALCASAAGLLAFRRKWFLAGVAGGLALQDWQVGGLLIPAVALAALVSPDRKRGAAQALGGAALALLPLLAYFAGKGALTPLFEQTIVASLFRGVSSVQSRGVIADWPRRFHLLASSPYSNAGLVWLAAPGLLLFARRLWRAAADRPPLVVLAGYHLGVIAYSLLDFQAYGDLFILQHTVAFFAAVALWSAYRALAEWSARGGSVPRRTAVALAALLAIMLIVRPWESRRDFRLVPRPPGTAVTLDAQRQVATRLAEPLARGRAVVLGPAEVLFLTGAANPSPLVYWNAATWAYYRRDAGETEAETLRRVVGATRAEVVICDPEIPAALPGPCPLAFGEARRTEAGPGGYAVDLYAVGRGRVSAAH